MYWQITRDRCKLDREAEVLEDLNTKEEEEEEMDLENLVNVSCTGSSKVVWT